MVATTAAPPVAYWRRTFNGLTGYIACFSGARNGKKLERPATRFYPYPHAVENAAAWLQSEAAAGREAYAAASLFTDNRKRDKRLSTDVACLWTDGDGALIPDGFPAPTLTVETSPGRWNYLWVLTRPIAPDQAEDLNRRIAYAIGADTGGWDIGQLLRVPGLPNYKYDATPTVTIVADDGPVHDPDELAAALPPAPADATRKRGTTTTQARISGDDDGVDDEPWIRGMNPDLWRGAWLTTTGDERDRVGDDFIVSAGAVDRSATLWHIACDADEHGAGEALIALILEDRDRALGFNKYTDRPAMYRTQAQNVVNRERTPQATVTPTGQPTAGGEQGGQTLATPTVSRLAAHRERRRRTRYAEMLRRERDTRRLLRDPELDDGEKVLALQMTYVTNEWERTPSCNGQHRLYLRKHAETWNMARATLSKRLDSLAAKTGAYAVHERRSKGPITDPDTGQIIRDRDDRPIIRYDTAVFVEPRAAGGAFLAAVVDRTHAPAVPRAAERTPKKPRGRFCQRHPEADLIAETTTVWRCSRCDTVVHRREHDRRVLPTVVEPAPAGGNLVTRQGWPQSAQQDPRDTAQNPATAEGGGRAVWERTFSGTGGQSLTTPTQGDAFRSESGQSLATPSAGPTFRIVDPSVRARPSPQPPKELLDDFAPAEGDA